MNKLTINRVALGSLKRRKGQYRAMILGAGLAIFFVSSLFLALQSIIETYRLNQIARMGSQDAILYDAERVDPQDMLDSGLVSEVGNVFVIAETEDSKCPIGYYDELGGRMAGRVATEGRLPERAGEIAVEPNFLQKLRQDAKIGDAITLMLKVPVGKNNQFLPDPVEKTYQLVGLLKPQGDYLRGNVYSDFVMTTYPNAIVSSTEQVELGGRAIIHRMVMLARGGKFDELRKWTEDEHGLWTAMSTQFNLFSPNSSTSEANAEGQTLTLIASIMGAVLILAACLGIVNAFAGSLTARRNQIGMMRAVGATSRQIRQVFGREALVLALAIAPVAIGLSYLFVWGLARWMGTVMFYANPWFLPLDLIASLLCVALAAWVPLRSASNVSPMQAIRDVSMLRAKKRVRIRQRPQFDVPRLIAARHLKLYRTRQMGIAAMVAVSMLLICMVLPFVVGLSSDSNPFAYQVASYPLEMDPFVESNVTPHTGLTDADVAEALSLPMVSEVVVNSFAQINLLVDQVTDYAKAMNASRFWSDVPVEDFETYDQEVYQQLRSSHNLTKEVLPSALFGCDASVLDALRPHVLEGRIDMDAINAGREVLVVAPKEYYQWRQWDAQSQGYIGRTDYKAYSGMKNADSEVRHYENDMYRVGDEVSILRLFTRNGINEVFNEGNTIDYKAGVQRQDAKATIGALLDYKVFPVLGERKIQSVTIGSVLTSHPGIAALGIETAGYANLSARLSGDPDVDTMAQLTDAFKSIASRGRDLRLQNNIQSAKDSAFWQGVLNVCLFAVVLLMMSMCVSLVNSAVSNRIKSEKRAIGTLRAVGAGMPEIVRSYRLQALTMVGWGVAAGIALSGIYLLWYYIAQYLPYDRTLDSNFIIIVPAQLIFLAAVALFCGVNLSLRIREITRESIVSNIREL